MTTGPMSDEMKSLTALFNFAGLSKKDSQRAIKQCRALEAAGNANAGLAASILSHVEGALDIASSAIASQLAQQKKIEMLEKRLEELEAPRKVNLGKPGPTPSPK